MIIKVKEGKYFVSLKEKAEDGKVNIV